MTDEENPVIDTLAEITTAAINHCDLASRELMLARIAVLAALHTGTQAARITVTVRRW